MRNADLIFVLNPKMKKNIVKNLGTELLRFLTGTTGHNVSSLQKHSIPPTYLFAGTSAYIQSIIHAFISGTFFYGQKL